MVPSLIRWAANTVHAVAGRTRRLVARVLDSASQPLESHLSLKDAESFERMTAGIDSQSAATKQAARFRSTPSNGVQWNQVVWRKTWDMNTHALLESRSVVGLEKAEPHRKILGGPRDVLTCLWFSSESPQPAVHKNKRHEWLSGKT